MGALVVAGCALLAHGQDAAASSVVDPLDQAKGILAELAAEPSQRSEAYQDRAKLLTSGFNAFIERMDAFDGELSVGLATELFREDPAIWSAFCLEGALRRSAPVGADGQSMECQAALKALLSLRESYTGEPPAQLDLTHRIAILGAGFGDRLLERSALGRALAAGGVDGAQISGLAALQQDAAAAQRLFGSLLDRSLDRSYLAEPGGQHDESVTPTSTIENSPQPYSPEASWRPRLTPESAPWALRGHALASLELLRRASAE
jgi:hypothetical protein